MITKGEVDQEKDLEIALVLGGEVLIEDLPKENVDNIGESWEQEEVTHLAEGVDTD